MMTKYMLVEFVTIYSHNNKVVYSLKMHLTKQTTEIRPFTVVFPTNSILSEFVMSYM